MIGIGMMHALQVVDGVEPRLKTDPHMHRTLMCQSVPGDMVRTAVSCYFVVLMGENTFAALKG